MTDTTRAADQGNPAAQVGKVVKSEAEWRAQLTPMEYHVLREAGTERAFTGEYTDTKTKGVYRCRACGAELFRSDTKFDSHCGWPSFYAPPCRGPRPLHRGQLDVHEARRGPLCHLRLAPRPCLLGEGYGTPTDQRYCINSISLTLEPALLTTSGHHEARMSARSRRRPV